MESFWLTDELMAIHDAAADLIWLYDYGRCLCMHQDKQYGKSE